MPETDGQLTLFDLDIWSGKTYPGLSPPAKEKTFEPYLKKPVTLYAKESQFLNLREGFGDLLGPFWEINSPSLGEYSTLNTGECPKAVEESSLLQILEASPPHEFYLTKTTCSLLLERLAYLNKPIPNPLRYALEIQAEHFFPPSAAATSDLPSPPSYTHAYCIKGNSINRKHHHGGNGRGVRPDICYTLTTVDRHCVFAYTDSTSAQTLYDKTAIQQANFSHSGIRYLTPLEWERMMGYPDHWTAMPHASNDARYVSLGNSVAIPCVTFLLQRIAYCLEDKANLPS